MSASLPPLALQATLMRGGTSKGLFLALGDLPAAAREPGPARDRLLLRALGSPDPYGKQIDGLGGGFSSTSKVVLVSPSTREDCDLDYWFGAVAIDAPIIDWSGNCGNLTGAVGPFAIARGLVAAPAEGMAVVRLWQANIGKQILAHVPVRQGQPLESGGFMLDGVSFPGAEIRLEFLDPAADGALFPTGRPLDVLEVPDAGRLEVTLIDAGNPTVFIEARALGLRGDEGQAEVNDNPALLARCEAIRACAAVAMGLATTTEEATRLRPATPKLAFVAPAADFQAAGGKRVRAAEIDLQARILSMGRLHHAMTGTGAVALAAAAAVPGTLVRRMIGRELASTLRFGHASGVLAVGAEARQSDGTWRITRVVMSRSARRLMEGKVWVPQD
ncbi:2-methylaconitate cis-trans isomerase PrpF family protein [Azotobacter armeniacus]